MHLMEHKLADHALCELEKRCPTPRPSASTVPCEGGQAGEYECSNVDQLAFVSLEDLGAGPTAGGNDIWGWTDPETGHEIAIMGTSDGTTFVDITDPREPNVLGRIETYTVSSLWRDIKVYNNHAYIGAEASGHGVQVFDLTNLRSLYGTDSRGANIRILREDAHYDEFGNSHNLAINEDTGFIYAIGSGTCNGGPHIIDIRTPAEPLFVGCFDQDGYTHDAECVTYTGPDAEFTGREICFLYNENTLTIADVTDKENIEQIARETYDDVYYTHQGWLFEDQTHLVLDDEIDELSGPTPSALPTRARPSILGLCFRSFISTVGHTHGPPNRMLHLGRDCADTRTLIWNLESLRNPTLVDSFFSEETVSDHNQYTHRDHVWQSNYMAGLRILKIDQVRWHKSGLVSPVSFGF
jgi:choice-of-anchor B domain-containing protein